MARLCGVRRQSIYLWIKEWKVERLVDALKLSRASGIPIEKFAGGMIDAKQPKGNKMTMFSIDLFPLGIGGDVSGAKSRRLLGWPG